MKKFEDLTIGDYASIIRRRIWYLIITPVLVTFGTVAYVWQLPSFYKSETTIQMSGRLLPEDYIRSLDRQTTNERMDFVRQELQSTTFLGEIVKEFQLGRPDRMEEAVNGVRSNIEITILTPTAFKLAFLAVNPNLAESVTRRLAERLIQLNDSSRKQQVQVADQFLEDQVQQAAHELSQAEVKQLEFRNRAFPGLSQEVVNSDGLPDLQRQLASLETRLQNAVNTRKSLNQRLEEHRQVKTVMKPPAVPAAPLASVQSLQVSPPSYLEEKLAGKRSELAALSLKYTPSHPDVARAAREVQDLETLITQSRPTGHSRPTGQSSPPVIPNEDRTRATIAPALDFSVDLVPAEIQLELDQVESEIATIEQAKRDLLGRISVYQSRLNPSPALAQQLAAMTRQHESARQRYNYLSDRKLSSEMA